MAKKKLSAPAGLDDWWNKGNKQWGTIKPSIRKQRGLEPRPFTAQETKEAWEHTLENGFC